MLKSLTTLLRSSSNQHSFLVPFRKRPPKRLFSLLPLSKVPSEHSKSFLSKYRTTPYHTRRSAAPTTTATAPSVDATTSSNTEPTATTSESRVYGVTHFSTKPMTLQIVLTDQERQICSLLHNATEYLKETKPELPEVVLRIAGGWVRDKLLGMPSHDIDIAVNNMMGFEFASHVNNYLKFIGHETRTIAKIDSNPEKSKHLETATTKVLGLDIDFVNLRNEVYNEDSRIPVETTFGTPEQDALRRDITINALFYNIHTHEVEDFTKMGLPDLAAGLIRTPLSAFETFRDDPLRVLRCVRFASRFGFKIVDDVVKAMENEEIKSALTAKISRERIGIEIDKIIKDADPAGAFDLICTHGLYPIVFAAPPAAQTGEIDDPVIGQRAAQILKWLEKNPLDLEHLQIRPEERRSLYLAIILLPYIRMTIPSKDKEVPGVQYVLRESLKFTNSDSETTTRLYQSLPIVQDAIAKHAQSPLDRGELGMLIRNSGLRWLMTVQLALVVKLLDHYEAITAKEINQVRHDAAAHEVLLAQAAAYGISECYTWKYLIDGKKVSSILGIKPGPKIGVILPEVMRWQLAHPDGTVEECGEFLKKMWNEKVKSVEG